MNSYISNRELDELGNALVRRYLERSGVQGAERCIDIVGLANFLGLNVTYEIFAERDMDKIGFLADGQTPLMINRNGRIIPFLFPLGTIVLDSFLLKDRESGRCRFTIAHEIAHFVINRHRPAPQFHRVYDSEKDYSLKEMIEVLCNDMFAKNLVTRACTWWVSYDYKSLEACPYYDGPVSLDFYGRLHPKHSGGTVKLGTLTNNLQLITVPMVRQFDEKTDHRLLYRRLGVCAMDVAEDMGMYQMNMFVDYEALERDRRLTAAMLEVRKRFGANAVFKGMNMLEGATTLERNQQIGGHRR